MTLQQLADKFSEAYGDDTQYVYWYIKTECLTIFGNSKSFSIVACDWMDKSADEMEKWIVEHIISVLAVEGFHKPHTKPMSDLIWNACRGFMKDAK